MPAISQMSSRHCKVRRSMSIVREAFVTSVTWTPPSVPPVMFQMSHVSGFPKASSPRSARSRTPGTFSRIHMIFVIEA